MSAVQDREAQLLERTRAFALSEVAPHVSAWHAQRKTSAALLAQAGAIGLLGMQVPQEHGGAGVRFSCKAEIAEILASVDFGLAMALINSHNVAAQLTRLADHRLIDRWVPDLLAGRACACTALTEPGAGSDFSAIATRASAVDGGWRLDGHKTWITNATHADLVVVYAQTRPDATAAGVAAFLVQATGPGYKRNSAPTMGPVTSMGTGSFQLDGYLCAPDEMISPPGQAFKDILRSINGARTYVAAMCCGMVAECLRIATTYGQARKAFGKALAAHQGWRWALADAAIDLDAARLMFRHAAAHIDAGDDAQSAAAKAKVFATRMAQRHISALLHSMGAEGLRADYPFLRHLESAQVAGFVDGSTEMLLERIAKDFKPDPTLPNNS